jgi:hypothetical protein
MGDPMVPERLGGRHAVAREQTGIPAMPVIGSSEQVLGGAYPLLDGISPTIGWEFRSEAKGGPGLVILRRTADMVVQLADHGWPTLTRLLNRQALLDSIRVGDLGFMKAPHVELFSFKPRLSWSPGTARAPGSTSCSTARPPAQAPPSRHTPHGSRHGSAPAPRGQAEASG